MIDVHVIAIDAPHALYGHIVACTCGNFTTGDPAGARRRHDEHIVLAVEVNRAADKRRPVTGRQRRR